MARVKYRTFGGGGSHGIRQPWWAIDYPFAEEHFFAALRRVTNITVADREAFVELSDDQIFQYRYCSFRPWASAIGIRRRGRLQTSENISFVAASCWSTIPMGNAIGRSSIRPFDEYFRIGKSSKFRMTIP